MVVPADQPGRLVLHHEHGRQLRSQVGVDHHLHGDAAVDQQSGSHARRDGEAVLGLLRRVHVLRVDVSVPASARVPHLGPAWLGGRELRHDIGVQAMGHPRSRRGHPGPAGFYISDVAQHMRDTDRNPAVIGRRAAPPRRVSGRRPPVHDVEALFVGVHMRGHRAARCEASERKAGVQLPSRSRRPTKPRGHASPTAARPPGSRPPPHLGGRDDACSLSGRLRLRGGVDEEVACVFDQRARPVDVGKELEVRLRNSPSTMTCSTLDTSAHSVTAATGSCTGATLIAVASITTMSAFLPGVRDPTRSSRPATWAPLAVAISSSSPPSGSCREHRCRPPSDRVDPRPFGAEGRTHLGEHVARHRRDDVDGQAWPQPELVTLVHRRPAVTHLQLDLGGDRNGATGVGDPLPLVLTE